jgi:surface antigen
MKRVPGVRKRHALMWKARHAFVQHIGYVDSAKRRLMTVPAIHAVRSMAAAVNMFPYGQCTWWANQRYFQLHGVFVPWGMNADASQWVQRAQDAHWQVSSQPMEGAIIVMQPGVQGAYGYGHVAVVERVLEDGSVVASSMNWGRSPGAVTEHRVHPGGGVTFVRQL